MTISSSGNSTISSPLVSIVAVCYNHAKYVEETLDSILNQSHKNIELVIIDSNSPDNSVNVIENWIERNKIDCTFIQKKEPRSICQNINEGLNIISGEYFQSIACDDIMMPEKIEKQVELFQTLDEDYALIYSDMFEIDENSDLLSDSYLDKTYKIKQGKTGNVFLDLFEKHFIPATTLLLKTSIVKELGGYDEDLSFEDLDMNLRLCRKYKVEFMPYKSVKYRIVQDSINRQLSVNHKYIRSRFKAFSKQLPFIKDEHVNAILERKLHALLIQ
ncbi:MAG: glycosyltransferase, partial [Bacteroidetes bacterium]|nr:glycosyltransferase [Bacteroidota bacterium]